MVMKIIGLPFSGGGLGHGNGANKAPEKIVELLSKNVFANEEGHDVKFDFENLTLDEKNILESHDKIKEKISTLNEKIIILGGDHSITAPTVEGFSKNNPDFMFIVFDAHPDLMDDFRPPTQEDYLRVLIEKKIVKSEQCILIGIRNWDKEEINYLKEKNIIHYTAKEIYLEGMPKIIEKVISKVNKEVYLSIDIDVVDPVEAIGTGYVEHGGISSRDLIYALGELKTTRKLAMVDIVEINPEKDVNDITSSLGAKLIAEIIDY